MHFFFTFKSSKKCLLEFREVGKCAEVVISTKKTLKIRRFSTCFSLFASGFVVLDAKNHHHTLHSFKRTVKSFNLPYLTRGTLYRKTRQLWKSKRSLFLANWFKNKRVRAVNTSRCLRSLAKKK